MNKKSDDVIALVRTRTVPLYCCTAHQPVIQCAYYPNFCIDSNDYVSIVLSMSADEWGNADEASFVSERAQTSPDWHDDESARYLQRLESRLSALRPKHAKENWKEAARELAKLSSGASADVSTAPARGDADDGKAPLLADDGDGEGDEEAGLMGARRQALQSNHGGSGGSGGGWLCCGRLLARLRQWLGS